MMLHAEKPISVHRRKKCLHNPLTAWQNRRDISPVLRLIQSDKGINKTFGKWIPELTWAPGLLVHAPTALWGDQWSKWYSTSSKYFPTENRVLAYPAAEKGSILVSLLLLKRHRYWGIYTKNAHWCTTANCSLPWKSGRHVEQDAPPLLTQMKLPDPSRSISASTHKPETGQRQTMNHHFIHRWNVIQHIYYEKK